MRVRHLAALAAALVLAQAIGCGSTPAPAPAPEPEPDPLTPYPGDELALAPPDPAAGFQLHYGPAAYTEEAMAEYLIDAGAEAENCYMTTTPNDTEVFISAYHGRMRPGSHHLIVWGLSSELAEGLGNCPFNRDKFIVGAQSPSMDITDEHGEGYALRIAPHTPVAVDLHYLNTTDETLLREAWVNFMIADPAEVKKVIEPIMWLDLGINVPPHTTHVEHSVCEAPNDVSIRMLTGHMHARGVRVSVWVNTGGERKLAYEAYDWEHPGELYYDAYTSNPSPDAATRTTGGPSGVLSLKKGDLVEWECEFDNPGAEEYHFGDSAKTNEMCNIFGMYYPSTGENWRCLSFD